MCLLLKNLQSNQLIKLKTDDPFIIGRTTVEGCTDKRVSRKHGQIICTVDGKINLLALHNNPIFFTKNGLLPVQQLNKDEQKTLGEGDCIGLLPNAFWFRITSEKSAASERDSVTVKTEMVCDSSINEDINTNENFNKTISCQSPQNQTLKNESAEPSSSQESKNLFSPELEKTRKLPLWMYEIDEPVKVKSPYKRKSEDNKEAARKKTKNEESKKTKSNDLSKNFEQEIVSSECPSTSKIPDIDITAVEESKECESTTSATMEESDKPKQPKEGYENDVNEIPTTSQASRPICQYESNCYRKNPQHKLEYSHPGDADYIPSSKRKVCPYGATCYRTNPSHRTEFIHPPSKINKNSSPEASPIKSPETSPLPPKRKRRAVKREGCDFKFEDDEPDDPFLDNHSSDEYVPSDSDEEPDSVLQEE